MKKGIHPEYRPVVFQDHAANFSFLTRSSVKTSQTVQWTDGQTYPLVNLDISSASHPFFTGKMKFIDTTGRVEKFQKKYNWAARGKKEDAPAQ
jgi:large subunit ribosomal protein L31